MEEIQMSLEAIIDNITSFIMDPSNHKRRPVMQGVAWATTIFLGIGTVGIAHGLSALWRRLRPVDQNETHKKICQLFNKLFSKNHENSHNAQSPQGDKSDKAVQHKGKVQNISQALTHQEIAQNVYDQREDLWGAAMQDANQDQTHAMDYFIQKIRNAFKENGKSLSKISTDKAALNTLFQSNRLRKAIVIYAKSYKLNDLLNEHLIFIAQNIYRAKEKLFNQAEGSLVQQVAHALLLIINVFKSEGRSLEEAFSSKEAMKMFKLSNRLMLVLDCYIKIKKQEMSQQKPSEEISLSDDKRARVKLARELGQRHAQEGLGLVSRLGLKAFRSDPEQLKKGIKKFLLKNHPDQKKDPIAEEPAKDANALIRMLNDNVYEHYREALEKHRGSNLQNPHDKDKAMSSWIPQLQLM